ncbi:MAG: SUMF1/EgtB/PvdO family nonheme iron enzyme [Labilithrix sp.]|nr:SUMF1/EgtB/PvdO family nonheme iron enzyme [Labilithrix sp.]MBX3225517.1 SUMF1/EgtB/PvdO family nonheme iron enzyme [Labilithrix sp.]
MSGAAFGLFATLYLVSPDLGTSGPFAGLERARRPPRVESLWHGLSQPTERAATASGVVALRRPHDRRVRIAGGRFVMGSTPQEMQEALQLCAREPFGPLCQRTERVWDVAFAVRAEGHAHEVTLSDFELDVTEVTVEKYGRCVAASACSPPSFDPGDPRYDVPSYPVTHVTWDDASSYCVWAGGRLPTEAEWELAARGHANNTFPWGKVYSPRLANHGAYADDPTDGRDGFVGLAPVGSFPDGATPTGLFDMAGNVAEWVADWYDRDEQQFGYRRGAQVNPTGPSFGVLGHVIRGGSYRDGAHWLRAAARRASTFAEREVGFRCAKSL